jgi:hypothetical protein
MPVASLIAEGPPESATVATNEEEVLNLCGSRKEHLVDGKVT